MILQQDVYDTVHDALAPIFSFQGLAPNIYENAVTGSLPVGPDGRPLPGAIIQMRHAVPLADDSLDGTQVLDARAHRLNTRFFAADEGLLRRTVDTAMVALTGLRIGGYNLRMTTEDEPAYELRRDPDVNIPYTYMHWSYVG